jgi:heat shock protein HslJ
MRWVLSAVLVVAAVASTSGRPASDVTMADLDRRDFTSTSEQPLVLWFADGGMHLDAGCNSIDGPYRVEGGRLRFSQSPWSTTASCIGPGFGRRNNREVWIRRLLTEGMVAHLDGDRLTLTGEGHTFELVETFVR